MTNFEHKVDSIQCTIY